MVEDGRDFWKSPCPTPQLSQGHQEALAWALSRRICISPWRETSQPLWAVTLTVNKVFPDVQTAPHVFQLLPIASCPGTGHQRKEPGSVFFAPSLQTHIHIAKIPPSLLFSRLNSPRSLSLSSYVRCSSPLIIFVVLCWTLSSMSMPVL